MIASLQSGMMERTREIEPLKKILEKDRAESGCKAVLMRDCFDQSTKKLHA